MKRIYKYVWLLVLPFLCTTGLMAQSKVEEARKLIQDGKRRVYIDKE